MKLSAPPPPPPPPPEPPDPNAANTSPTAPDAPAPEVPETPPAPPGPKPRTWPAWYSGIDAALVGLVLVFAFGAASFVARNSDVWLHLAAGKRLFAGQYVPGSDPFSYSAADRAWVNHSWLLDAISYLLYGGKGFILSGAKAVVITLAFGLLIAIRRPQFPLWPWAAVACVAVLAAAPQFILRPLVMSIFFLSVTMYLLFRLPHKPNSMQFPLAIGVTFWLWSNCDQWFFVGPLALALLVVGDLIQTKLLNSPDEPPAEGVEEPLGRLPDALTLAKALGIGVLACMLNPNHIRVWELPVELIKPAALETDPRLRPLLYGPTDSLYMDHPGLGYNLNGLAFAVLFIGGAVALGFGSGRVRVAHIALFVGFAALSLVSMYAIPFLAVVAVPLIASQLNASSARAELKPGDDPKSRLLLIGSSLGRIASVLGVCALCVIAYPGWVHPETSNAAYARRVGWGVEPEPSMVQAAEQFKAWRESGKLAPDARGFVTHIELANYLAWFAPQEKVFINGRYNHHLRELPDYVSVRKGLGLIEMKDEQPKRADATEVLRKVNAEYLAIHSGPNEGVALINPAGNAVVALYRDAREWSPWYLDGRTTVFGWRPPGAPAAETFMGLRVDPILLAFGPKVTPLKDEPPKPPLAPLNWEEAFVRPPKPAPTGAAEALGWIRFRVGPALRQDRRQVIRSRVLVPLFFGAPATDGTAHGFWVGVLGEIGALRFPPDETTDPGPAGLVADDGALRATPLLALRAARRAIAEDPDHPDGYFALALALDDPNLPLTESERTLGRVAALRQCLIRMPKPDRYKRGQFTAPATDVALQLVGEYLGRSVAGPRDLKTGQPTIKGYLGMPIDVAPLNDILGQAVLENTQNNQLPIERVPFAATRTTRLQNARIVTGNVPHFLPLDVARDTLVLALEYLPIDTAGDLPEEAKKRTDRLDAFRKEVETALIRANERYGQAKGASAPLPQLIATARNSGLPGAALELLSGSDLERDFKEGAPQAAVLWASLQLALGRLEDLTGTPESPGTLATLETSGWAATLDRVGLAGPVRQLKYQKALHAGEYKTAGETYNTIAGRGVGEIAKLPPLGPTFPQAVITRTIAAVAGSQTQQEADKAFLAVLVPPLTPLTPLTRALATEVWRNEWTELAGLIRVQIVTQLRSDAEYFTRRGTLSLLEGDMPAAKLWFQQARREPPAGWGLVPEHPQFAVMYLRLIELAEKKAAAP